MELKRREFINLIGVGALNLSLSRLYSISAHASPYLYSNWEDIYRGKWTWDKVAKSTHDVNCWYQGRCTFDIYVKDGIVFREEQTASYPQTNSEVPDYNPKGCQKGACFSHRMYDPSRLKYPLKRIGKRGEGKFKRVSWDEALTEIANKIVDLLTKHGPDRMWWEVGTNLSLGFHGLIGIGRTAYLTDTVVLEANGEIGDDHQGAVVTCGKIFFESSSDDWFYSDLILLWGGNPSYTLIPNAHFFLEARYRGANLISICPDYNPSSIHCDLWVPVEIGTDAALALSMAHVIIKEKLYKEDFIKEQTDLPLLVREDTRKFLREKDLKEKGEDDIFYLFNQKARSITEALKKSLHLDGIDPALEGEYAVNTLEGEVKVMPVFQILKERILKEYSPEKVSKICGINPDLIRRLAELFATAESVTNITTANFSKFYHGFEMERAQILLFALCGHFGKKGSGFNAFPPEWYPDSLEKAIAAPSFPLPEAMAEVKKREEEFARSLKDKGYTEEMISYEISRMIYKKKAWLGSTLAWYIHGGLDELNLNHRQWDPYLKRDIKDYIEESLGKGWQYVEPPPGRKPLILFIEGGNFLRRVRGYTKLIETLVPNLELIVNLDWRMSNTCLYSDFILPVSGFYEKNDFARSASITPFASVTTKVVEPLGESKGEWQIHCLLAKYIQEIAKKRGILTFKDREGKYRRLDTLYDDFTYGKTYTENDEEKLADDLLKVSSNVEGVSWKELKEKGFKRFSGVGRYASGLGMATDILPDETITPLTWHIQKKMVWPTLTRRMQFYIDHELYFELGEELPVHKDNPIIGGNYPLKMTGGHTRWSIHANWRDHAYMLRLQRGEPILWMSVEDAKKRDIKDGDRVRVFNDIGSFSSRAKICPSVRPFQVIVYHAWEPYQFEKGRSQQSLIPSPINPIELAGGYYHLRPYFFQSHPGQCDRGTRVEVEKLI